MIVKRICLEVLTCQHSFRGPKMAKWFLECRLPVRLRMYDRTYLIHNQYVIVYVAYFHVWQIRYFYLKKIESLRWTAKKKKTVNVPKTAITIFTKFLRFKQTKLCQIHHQTGAVREQIWVHDIVTCISDYRRGLGWWLDLLTTYTHNSWLRFTEYCHAQNSVVSLLVCSSRCLVTAFNDGRSAYCGFLNYPGASATSF
jgi:hypothetical protein